MTIGKLEEKLQHLEQLREQGLESKSNPIWNRFNDFYSRLSPDQQELINSSDLARESENRLMLGFNQYLFEKFKDDFPSYQNGKYSPIINQYIDDVQKITTDYAKNQQELVSNAQSLQDRVKELEEQLAKQNQGIMI